MSQPFLGEVRLAGFGTPPRGWALCNGQLLPIAQNQALFAILGTTYGGDGRTTFALPNLQGRAPTHVGGALVLGQAGGEATHTLGIAEIPTHNHALIASSDLATSASPAGAVPAAKGRGGSDIFAPAGSAPVALNAGSMPANFGGSPHENMQPYQTVSFMIALQGIFPSHP